MKGVLPTFERMFEAKNNARKKPAFEANDRALLLYRWPEQAEEEAWQGEIPRGLIQFYFCLQGALTFSYHGGRYEQQLKSGRTFLMYNPGQNLQLELRSTAGTQCLMLFITVERLHQLFIDDSSELAFLNNENINKKFYVEKAFSPLQSMVLNQFFNENLIPSNQRLYFQGKILELLSLFFNQEESANEENCPFLLDEANVEKIRLAKRIVIERMTDPPALKDLAREVGLNEYQLKAGFKNIYGSPVFQFLTDYKMEHARKLLDTQEYKVNEVGFMVGYSNPSHFIAAFKKKFGTTPKKYSMALQA